MPGSLVEIVAHGNRLRGDDEEPAAGHRHHHVPDEPGHGEGRLELPETLPGRQVESVGDLDEVGRHAAQRLVERKGHVPGLAREDREDRSRLIARDRSRKHVDEEHDKEGEETQDRHRLQDVEQRNQDLLGPFALGGQRRISEREDEREGERDEHPQRGAQGVIGQVGIGEADVGGARRRQRLQDAMAGVDHGDEDCEDQGKGEEIELVGQGPAAQRGECDELGQCRFSLKSRALGATVSNHQSS